jgi:hypothetical protein
VVAAAVEKEAILDQKVAFVVDAAVDVVGNILPEVDWGRTADCAVESRQRAGARDHTGAAWVAFLVEGLVVGRGTERPHEVAEECIREDTALAPDVLVVVFALAGDIVAVVGIVVGTEIAAGNQNPAPDWTKKVESFRIFQTTSIQKMVQIQTRTQEHFSLVPTILKRFEVEDKLVNNQLQDMRPLQQLTSSLFGDRLSRFSCRLSNGICRTFYHFFGSISQTKNTLPSSPDTFFHHVLLILRNQLTLTRMRPVTRLASLP